MVGGPPEVAESRAVFVGARYEHGAAGETVGANVAYGFESSEASGGLGVFLWHGPGLTFALVASQLVVGPTYHIDLFGDAGGFAIEAQVAVAPGGPQLVGQIGAYLGFYFVDVGYAYQLPLGPLDRPEWMSSHQLSVRVQVPLR